MEAFLFLTIREGSYKGKISKDGNMIEFDQNKDLYYELARK